MRVGIPRGLLYPRYGVAWETLLTSLGHEVVISPPTNRSILDEGCRLAVDETCLSVKAYLGHVAWLHDRCDAILVPRVVSVRRRERECVKMWGIHDIARNSLPEANIISYSVDAGGVTEKPRRTNQALHALAVELGASPMKAAWAVSRARLAQARMRLAHTREQERMFSRGSADAPRVLVVGHGYNLHDEMIGAPIVKALRELGCNVVDAEAVPPRKASRLGKKMSPGLNWTNNLQLLGAIEHWRKRADGIVFIVTFPCGPDSLVTELALRSVSDVPMVTLILDEHSGEGGLKTRLESFVDILGMKRAAL